MFLSSFRRACCCCHNDSDTLKDKRLRDLEQNFEFLELPILSWLKDNQGSDSSSLAKSRPSQSSPCVAPTPVALSRDMWRSRLSLLNRRSLPIIHQSLPKISDVPETEHDPCVPLLSIESQKEAQLSEVVSLSSAKSEENVVLLVPQRRSSLLSEQSLSIGLEEKGDDSSIEVLSLD